MIKKLDKYIIGKFISTFLFTMLIFTLISIVIDFSDKVEEFIDKKPSLQAIIVDYYLSFIFWINGLLWPLFALISVIFFTSRMASNSEIISILNAGVSFKRILVPYMAAAGLIAGVHLFANHFLIPIGNKSKIEFEHSYVWTEHSRVNSNDIHMFISPNEKIYVRHYSDADTTARDLRIETYENNELIKLVKASNAKWKGGNNVWQLKNYQIRTFSGLDETFISGKGKSIDTTFNLRPEDFVRYDNQKEIMTTPQLLKWIESERRRGLGNTKKHVIEIQRRTADPVTILILTLIGMVISARKVRGGMGLHLAIGIGLGAIFIFLSRFTQTFAMSESIPPTLGVWLPNIVFGTIAIYLFTKAQK